MLKRFCSFVVIVAMVVPLLFSGVVSEAAVTVNGRKIILADFSNEGEMSEWTAAPDLIYQGEMDVAGGEKVGVVTASDSAKNTTTIKKIPEQYRDFSSYLANGAIYLWVYSPENCYDAEAKTGIFNLILYTGRNENKKDMVYVAYINLDFEGWKLISIPLKSLYKSWSPNIRNVESIRIIESGYNVVEAPEGTTMYVSKIWIDDIHSSETLAVSSSTIADGSIGVSCDTDKIRLEFNAPLFEKASYCASLDLSCTAADGTEEELTGSEFEYEIFESAVEVNLKITLKKGATYKVSLKNFWGSNGACLDEYSLEFTTDDGTAHIVELINSSSGASELGEALNSYQEEFGLAEDDYTNFEKYKNLISWLEYNKPYVSMDAIKEQITEAPKILDKINSSVETGIGALADELFESYISDNEATEVYASLVPSQKSMYLAMLNRKLPAESASEFIEYAKETVLSFASSVEEASGEELVISDFSKGDINKWNTGGLLASANPDFANGDEVASISITEDGQNSNATLNVADIDFDKYKAFNIWVYSPVVTDTSFNLTAYAGRDAENKWIYFYKLIPLDFEGWKLINIPFSSMSVKRSAQWSDVTTLYIFSGQDGLVAKKGTEFSIASISLAQSATPQAITISSSSLTDGADDILPSESFEITYSGGITANKYEKVLTDNSGKVVPTFIKVSANSITVTPNENLIPSESYTLRIRDVYGPGMTRAEEFYANFKVKGADIVVSEVLFSTSKPDGKSPVAASVRVSSSSVKSENVEFVLAVFDKNGYMCDLDSSSLTLKPGESAEMICASGSAVKSDATVKAFVVHTSDAQKPLMKKYAAIKGNGSYEYPENESFAKAVEFGENSFAITELKVLPEGVSIMACSKENRELPVVIKISEAKSGNTILYDQVSTNSEGCLEYFAKVDFENIISGSYKVLASSNPMTNKSPAEYEVYLASDCAKNEILDIINSTKTKSDLTNALKDNAQKMNLAEFDFSKAAYLTDTLFDAKPFDSYDEITELINRANDVMSAINSAEWTKYPDVLRDNADIIFKTASIKKSYEKLSDSEKGKVAKLVSKKVPFDSFADFEDEISDAISEINDSGSGDSGGSSGSKPQKGGYQSAGDSVIVPSSTPEANSKYTDLSGFEWAQTYIYSLKEKGVLTMSADRKFRPADSVTREEFVKMIVCAFGLKAEGNMDFSDVSENDWYYEYVKTAYLCGIINGTSADTFGSGMPITREQMAAIVYRASEIKSGTFTAEVEFTDDTMIEPYAKEAVYAMKNAGVINGMGDGSFAPKSNTTRAQAAKVIAAACGL